MKHICWVIALMNRHKKGRKLNITKIFLTSFDNDKIAFYHYMK